MIHAIKCNNCNNDKITRKQDALCLILYVFHTHTHNHIKYASICHVYAPPWSVTALTRYAENRLAEMKIKMTLGIRTTSPIIRFPEKTHQLNILLISGKEDLKNIP